MTEKDFIKTVYNIVLDQYIVPKFINDEDKTHKMYSHEDIITLLNTIVGFTQYNSEWADDVLEEYQKIKLQGGEDNETKKKTLSWRRLLQGTV